MHFFLFLCLLIPCNIHGETEYLHSTKIENRYSATKNETSRIKNNQFKPKRKKGKDAKQRKLWWLLVFTIALFGLSFFISGLSFIMVVPLALLCLVLFIKKHIKKKNKAPQIDKRQLEEKADKNKNKSWQIYTGSGLIIITVLLIFSALFSLAFLFSIITFLFFLALLFVDTSPFSIVGLIISAILGLASCILTVLLLISG